MKASSIAPREVDCYDRMADQWWDAGGKFWPLHRLNRLRSDYLKNAICLHFGRFPQNPQPLAGIDILDVGCGGGILSESMAALGASVHGIDVSGNNIGIARQHAARSGLDIEYENITVEDLARRGKKYDVFLNMEVVEHVADLSGFMAACASLVGDSGMMFVATINRNLKSWLFAIVGAEYVLGWLPRGTHTWRIFVRPGELESMLEPAGLDVTARAGVGINPFTRAFSLRSSLTVNYMLTAIRNKSLQ